MASKMKIGDVIQFPLGENKVAIGQVVADYEQSGWQYLVFFGPLDRSPRKLDSVLCQKPALIGLTGDGRVISGDWKIVANEPINPRIPLPAFQESIGTINNVFIEDYSGNRSRPATAQEKRIVPHREFLSPMVLEKAMRSLAGLEPWLEAFDSLRPNEETSTRRLFGSQ